MTMNEEDCRDKPDLLLSYNSSCNQGFPGDGDGKDSPATQCDAGIAVNSAPGPHFDGSMSVVNSTCQFGGSTVYHGAVTVVLPDGHADVGGLRSASGVDALSMKATNDLQQPSSSSFALWCSLRLRRRGAVIIGLVLAALCLVWVLLECGPATFDGLSTDSGQGITQTATPDPRASVELVSRQSWGALPPRGTAPLATPVKTVIIHHTGGPECVEKALCSYTVRAIQQHHMGKRNWWDIGYNFLIGGDGFCYEGRGWNVQGAHTFGWNLASVGVAVIGTFCDAGMPTRQLDALRRLLRLGEDLGMLQRDYVVLSRCQLPGDAYFNPGPGAVADVQSLSHWINNSLSSCLPCQEPTTPTGTDTTPEPDAEVGLVSRQGWGAQPPKGSTPLATPVKTVIVHHTAGLECVEEALCQTEVRVIQKEHMRKWSDIGYNFLVGGDGRSYEGRGWDVQGAHTRGWNNKSVGVALLGTFCGAGMPAGQLAALRRLLRLGEERGKLRSDFELIGRCQVSAALSPGPGAMVDVQTLHHWKNDSLSTCLPCS